MTIRDYLIACGFTIERQDLIGLVLDDRHNPKYSGKQIVDALDCGARVFVSLKCAVGEVWRVGEISVDGVTAVLK